MKKHPRLQRGFTLVELLVVIVIIAVLTSFAMSMIKRGKKSAISAATLNNLREIGVAAMGYMGENNNVFPGNWYGSKNQTWAQLFDPYMHGVEKYQSTQSKFVGPNKRLPILPGTAHPITYSANMALMPDGDALLNGQILPVSISKVHNVSQVILMADGCQDTGNYHQSHAGAEKLNAQVGSLGTAAKSGSAVPVGPNEDTTNGTGWFRYDDDKCHALMVDGSATTFKKGTMKYRNLWHTVVY